MMRRALHLDHFAPPRRVSLAGIAVLGAALAVAVLLAVWQQHLVGQIELLELQQAQLAPRRPATERPPSAQMVAFELRLPWLQLFDAVESAADPNAIALLSIEPDARRSALRISGEARSKKAMLDYMQRLGEQSPMVRAVLESHQQRSIGGAAPVQFVVMATWEQSK